MDWYQKGCHLEREEEQGGVFRKEECECDCVTYTYEMFDVQEVQHSQKMFEWCKLWKSDYQPNNQPNYYPI